MARARRRKQSKNRFSIILALTVTGLIVGAAGVGCISLDQKLESYKAQKTQLEAQIDKENKRSEEIEEYSKYVQTDQYVEDAAREKLGMAKSNDIIFKNEDAAK